MSEDVKNTIAHLFQPSPKYKPRVFRVGLGIDDARQRIEKQIQIKHTQTKEEIAADMRAAFEQCLTKLLEWVQ